MSATALSGAVELLDRSLAYVRPGLAGITPAHLGRRTPCHDWPLAVLLWHMDDGLDAWTEAATGRVSLLSSPGAAPVQSVRDKACALLGWWLDHPPERVDIGDLSLPAQTLVAAAALEVTLHGWDVHATVGPAVPVPTDLARPLLQVARHLVSPADRGACMPPPVLPGPAATDSQRLLSFLGRG